MWGATEFFYQLRMMEWTYHHDNAWVRWWSDQDIVNCWRMYNTSKRPSTGFLLLGDKKIRTCEVLLKNFGTATANKLERPNERLLVEKLNKWRQGLNVNTSHPPAKVQYNDVEGTGSILLNPWTPMLNDSFMLGGIHNGLAFHLAEDLFHANTLHMQGMTADEKWRDFFQTNPMFWDNNTGSPRIFARECIGLKAAGYRPFFSDYSLIFHGPAAPQFNFALYLAAINTAGLTAYNKAAAMEAISDFLFGDRDAIRDTAFPAQH